MSISYEDFKKAHEKLLHNTQMAIGSFENFEKQALAASHIMTHIHKVIVNEFLTETIQYRHPKSKKKRIQKKWRKNPNNWKTRPIPRAFYAPDQDVFVMHPDTAEKLKKKLNEFNAKQGGRNASL